jgi:hypothetical protein
VGRIADPGHDPRTGHDQDDDERERDTPGGWTAEEADSTGQESDGTQQQGSERCDEATREEEADSGVDLRESHPDAAEREEVLASPYQVRQEQPGDAPEIPEKSPPQMTHCYVSGE